MLHHRGPNWGPDLDQPVKRVSQPEYKHNLYLGERVEFAKALGLKGFWVAVVT